MEYIWGGRENGESEVELHESVSLLRLCCQREAQQILCNIRPSKAHLQPTLQLQDLGLRMMLPFFICDHVPASRAQIEYSQHRVSDMFQLTIKAVYPQQIYSLRPYSGNISRRSPITVSRQRFPKNPIFPSASLKQDSPQTSSSKFSPSTA
jgi:hypothetical protein